MANNKDFKVKNGIGPTVYHETVGTVTSGSEGYYLAGAEFDNVTASISQAGDERGLTFSTDGTKFYIMDGNTPQSVYQYNLSTAWDLSTSSYSNNSFNISSQETQPTGIAFKSDGTKMYVTGYTGDDVNEYTLSTAWDVSTASYSQVFSVSSQLIQPADISFKPDGTEMYVSGYNSSTEKRIYQYTLSTAWDVSTASYSSKTTTLLEFDGIHFKSDGTELFVVGNFTDTVYKYTLSTAWDVSTATSSGTSFSVSSQDTVPYGLAFKDDGTKMYVMGVVGTDVNQYSTVLNTASLDLSTGSVFEHTVTKDEKILLSNPADSGVASNATLLLQNNYKDISTLSYDNIGLTGLEDSAPRAIQFKTDGTKMYILGAGNDNIYQFSLSTAWDVSTFSYDSVSFSQNSQESAAQGLWIKPDGTKFYLAGPSSDTVYQYSMSTAWDMSTASYDNKSKSVSSEDGSPSSLVFREDGLKMFVLGNQYDKLFQYTLSTAWDVSTATYDSKSLSLSTQDTNVKGMWFVNSKTIYVIGTGSSDSIFEYTLTTDWDVSTGSYTGNSYSFTSLDGNMEGMYIYKDKLYMVGSGTDKVFQFSLSSFAITYDDSIKFNGGTAPTAPSSGETDILTFSTRDGGTSYQAVLAMDGVS